MRSMRSKGTWANADSIARIPKPALSEASTTYDLKKTFFMLGEGFLPFEYYLELALFEFDLKWHVMEQNEVLGAFA